MKYTFTYSILLIAGCFFSCQKQKNETNNSSQEYTNYVDPLIGTAGHGHTYPGATVPFGMIQLSPDNGISAWDWCSGYNYSDSLVAGFSHLHLSGTGIGDLNDILIMPTNKKIDLRTKVKDREDIPYLSKYSHEKETAKAGYYSLYLETPKVQAELTTSKRVGYHRYTFEENAIQSIVLDLGFTINWDKPTATAINIEDEVTLTGYRHSKGWAKNQKVFFTVKFSKPIISSSLFADGKTIESKTKKIKGTKTSAQFFFDSKDTAVLEIQVALSSVSTENAKQNLGKTQKFDVVRKEAKELWEEALGKIKVESPTDSLKTIFYTALYHTQVAPVTFSDTNGQCRLQNDSIVTSDFTVYSTLSLWDTFRAEHPLLTLLTPERVSDMIKSMLLYYDEHKRLPVWTLYGNETDCMTGYHSIPVIVEAYKKGIRDFDVQKAYEAMKATMMQGDRGLEFYKKYGYIPYNKLDESVTISLEYAYDDWCVAQLALALENQKDYVFFMKRSEAYKHLFDAKTGFMRGKAADGKSWNVPFDPKHSNHREHTDYTEGNAWQHSWFVLHDVENFIELHGGKKVFTKRLEQLFVESSEITGENVSVDISGLIGQYAHGNEPSHHIPYLFNYAGQPWRTQYWVREILKSQYNTTPEGLSGNEDCGQMSAWYVFGAMGLYPFNPASGEYQIASPIFEKTSLQLPNGKTFTIVAENTSDENRYIQAATLNGETFDRTYITHEEILKGGKLKLIMNKTPNKKWGLKE